MPKSNLTPTAPEPFGWCRFCALCVAVALVLAACSPRGTIQFAPDSAEVGRVHTLLVASIREPEPGPAVLSGQRAQGPSFFDFSVSVPPERDTGTVRFARSGSPDPTTDFATVSARQLADIRSFQAVINQRISQGTSPQKEVVIFVHGFNTTFAEGLYRQAQLAHDFDNDSISVNFSWASAGSVRAYAFDRESALIARDALEGLIAAIQGTRAERIVVIAHSMGAQLTMETMRQMAIRKAPGQFSKLSSIVLVAPDLDVELFVSQARRVAAADIPIYVFASDRDRALQFSALLRGRRTERLGLVTDAAVLGDLPVAIIDTSSFEANGDPLQHFKAATSPTMIALLSGTGTAGLEAFVQGTNQPGLLEGSVEAFQDVLGGALR